MIAKEAIEIVGDPRTFRLKTNIELEALSIVLESAKLFHKHSLPFLAENSHRVLGSTEWDTVYGIPLEDLGIRRVEK